MVSKTAADWLERDLQLVKPGTRIMFYIHYPSGHPKFGEVMVKYKVTQVFSGHSHRYKRTNFKGIPRASTINLRGNGACTLAIFYEDRVELVDRCPGCKGDPTYHSSKWCALGTLRRSNHASRRGRHVTLTGVSFRTAKTIDVHATKGLEILTEIDPQNAEQVGLRLSHPGEKEEPFEIICERNVLLMGGVEIPFQLAKDEMIRWHVFVEKGQVKLFANYRIHFVKPFKTDSPMKVQFFAKGDRAVFKKLDV
jgi:hypothetical protein